MKNDELTERYFKIKGKIERRIAQFEKVGRKGGKALFEELAFCLLTPQSKARLCHKAICELKRAGLLFGGNARQIAGILSKKTRFHNKKARYIVEARKKFSADGFASLEEATFSGSEQEARERLRKSVAGLGMKEASHYLRNVGRGKTIAILDRHILKNLSKYKVIKKAPKSLTCKRYLEIERRMLDFCRKAKMPPDHMDFVFWSSETGEVFK